MKTLSTLRYLCEGNPPVTALIYWLLLALLFYSKISIVNIIISVVIYRPKMKSASMSTGHLYQQYAIPDELHFFTIYNQPKVVAAISVYITVA